MSSFIIQGPQKLKGEIAVKGAKNHALKVIAASFLSAEKITIENVPQIEDVNRLLEITEDIGAKVENNGSTVKIQCEELTKKELSTKLVPKLRSSIVLLGPLLARFKEVTMPHPGGCQIGKRPIDVFLKGFKAFGVDIKVDDCTYHFKTKGLKGIRFDFPKPSVTGTETLMMAATLAEGKTTLVNCASEPEIPALAEYLNSQGANIKGAGTHTIEIKGVKKLSAGTCKIIPDRIEAASFAIMAAATNSEIKITNCRPLHSEIPLNTLKEMGVNISWGEDWIQVKNRENKLRSMKISTKEYPGFPTDLQAPIGVLLTQAEGTSTIFETIFEDRFMYVDFLKRMGADITRESSQKITIQGPSQLSGKQVESPDLRAGIAMVIAGMVAKGETKIGNIYQIERGYENIRERLNNLGANIKK
ncbi:MAG: UDP-N-acetylglucosamine 1-carboxyvinyltransferase [Patescibacteria group bacterium]